MHTVTEPKLSTQNHSIHVTDLHDISLASLKSFEQEETLLSYQYGHETVHQD